MAKVSISKILRRRNKFRFLTFLALTLLVFISFQFVTKNPHSSLAISYANIDGSGGNNDLLIDQNGDLRVCSSYTDSGCPILGGVGRYGHMIIFSGSGGGIIYVPNDGTRSIEITGNVTVTMYAYEPMKLNTIKISYDATLTHAPLTTADITNKAVGSLTAEGNAKKINIEANDVQLIQKGKINVDGKGYPGGISTSKVGYGPGGGASGYTNDNNIDNGGGGGGHGGAGGDGYGRSSGSTYIDYAGGVANDNTVNPILHGSGGGFSSGTDSSASGGAGGGLVRITAGSFLLDNNSSVSANGAVGPKSGDSSGGGGSGGAIYINVNTYSADFSKLQSVAAGTSLSNLTHGKNGSVGSISISEAGVLKPTSWVNSLVAGGGNSGNDSAGGGGGGIIALISSNPFKNSCRLVYGSFEYIPAGCENRDVIIDAWGSPVGASYTVYADAVAVWQNTPGRELCSGPETVDVNGNSNGIDPVNMNNAFCNTTRRFASLTITNNAVLTHRPVSIGEINGNVVPSDYGTGRWRRVDIVVDGNFRLESNASINVDLKGYPGGVRYTHESGYGTGGSIVTHIDNPRSSGAGFGGAGGVDDQGYPGGIVYASRDNFELGSGSAYNGYAGGDGAEPLGGHGEPGGGRARIVSRAGNIYLGNNTTLTANGGAGRVNCGGCGHQSSTGGGSGGMIYLKADKINFQSNPKILVAGGVNGSRVGGIGSLFYDSAIKMDTSFSSQNILLSANGGDASYESGAGAGGVIVISKNNSEGVTIKKKLQAISRPWNSTTPNPNFNPYALQSGDRIKVIITVANIPPEGVSLYDEMLSTNTLPAKRCDLSGTPIGNYTNVTRNTGVSPYRLEFSGVTSGSNGTAEITYLCDVN